MALHVALAEAHGPQHAIGERPVADAVRRLERLRELRPTGPQLAQIVRGLGVAEDDFVIEQERFQMLFPSGREFLFAPVVEHGPLRLWKAVIGKDGSPQELFWRLKEAIDIYYTGHVLAVNVMAGLMNITVAKGTESPGPRLAARYWRHYPGLDNLWGGLAAGYVRVSEPSLPPFGDVEFDFDIQIDEGEARRTGAHKPVTTSSIPIATDDLDGPVSSGPALKAVRAEPVRAEPGAGRRTEAARPLTALGAQPPAAGNAGFHQPGIRARTIRAGHRAPLLDRVSRDRTTLVIAHRLSTIRTADHIVVMHHGRLAEQGTHAALMARPGGIYQRLVQLQRLADDDGPEAA